MRTCVPHSPALVVGPFLFNFFFKFFFCDLLRALTGTCTSVSTTVALTLLAHSRTRSSLPCFLLIMRQTVRCGTNLLLLCWHVLYRCDWCFSHQHFERCRSGRGDLRCITLLCSFFGRNLFPHLFFDRLQWRGFVK